MCRAGKRKYTEIASTGKHKYGKCKYKRTHFVIIIIIIIIIIIRTFVTLAVSANILNLRRRQSLGEEVGGSEV